MVQTTLAGTVLMWIGAGCCASFAVGVIWAAAPFTCDYVRAIGRRYRRRRYDPEVSFSCSVPVRVLDRGCVSRYGTVSHGSVLQGRGRR